MTRVSEGLLRRYRGRVQALPQRRITDLVAVRLESVVELPLLLMLRLMGRFGFPDSSAMIISPARASRMLSFETSESGGVLIVAFEDKDESMDNRQASQRQTLYLTIESQSDPRFAFDLGGVRYLTSSDIGFLITLRRRIAARKGRVILFSVDPYLLDILRTMKLITLFEFASDQRETLARLSAPPGT